MAALNEAHLLELGTSTMATSFFRGPRKEVKMQCSGACGDLRRLCKAGELKRALHNLVELGISADSTTYICLLQECIKIRGLVEGNQVHAHIIRNGFIPNTFLLNILVNMYAKCGSLVDARQVFDKMPERDMFTWNIMMAGYAKHGYSREAIKIYRKMILERVTPDKVTFTCILKACASLGSLAKGKEVHADIIKAAIEPDIILENILIDMYAKCGNMKDARQLFDDMAARDVVSWNAMIAGYSQQGCGREALQLFEEMQKEGLKPNVVSWSAMIAGYAQHGCNRDAFEMYEQMLQASVKPNMVTFICILNACTSLGALEKGKEVHADIFKAGIASDIILDTALVNMYAKCGNIDDARKVFDGMPNRNVVSWSTMIAGYAQHGCGREACEMYEQMKWEGVKPNIVTFTSVLNACASLVALEKGIEVHGDIIKARIVPDIILENTLVNMYATCGSIKDASQVFGNIAKRDVVSWNAMIAAYAQHGCGREALQLFEQMQQEGLKPEGITFTSVISVCRHLGLVDEGCHYFDSMSQDQGLIPTTEHFGCMVDLLGRAGCLDKAEDFIKKMPVKPDALIWRALLGACRTHGNVEVAERAAKCLLGCERQGAAT